MYVYESKRDTEICYVQMEDGSFAPIALESVRKYPQTVLHLAESNAYLSTDDPALGRMLMKITEVDA